MTYVGTQQKTISQSVTCSGLGLHTGESVSMLLKPAPADTGIVFRRLDVEQERSIVVARYDYVTQTRLGTTISNHHGVSISTVEHFLSAVFASGIDNLYIDIDGPEVPVMDGSAAPFLFFLECAGIRLLDSPKEYLKITQTIKVQEGDKYAMIAPCDSFQMDFVIQFDTNAIGTQTLSCDFSGSFFKTEMARARTFGFAHEVEMLRKAGLARGGSIDNAVVIQDDKVINPNGLRYQDEFVRHKMLDAVGDLSLAGMPLLGHYQGFKSGHDLNNRLLREVFAQNAFLRVQYPIKTALKENNFALADMVAA